MADQLRRAFVVGHPIAHSRSPMIHGHWLREHNITGSYEAVDIAPAEFAGFLSGQIGPAGFIGGNVTIPHKEAAFVRVGKRDEAATRIGAVNTVWTEDGVLHGSNTDAYGFAANLDQNAPGWDSGKIAVVLGAGGASRAILYALQGRDFTEIRLVNRTVSRARELAAHFGGGISPHDLGAADELVGDASLIVNTTALGMHGFDDLPLNVSAIADGALVTDIVYVPLETTLLAAARQRGLRTVDGLGMLLHQAVPGFERWFGVKPSVTNDLRALIVADIEKHA